MAKVFIPALLRPLTGQRDEVEVAGGTVGELIANLDAQFPGIRARLCAGDGLRQGLAVTINSEIARFGMSQPVPDGAEMHFVHAIAGG